MIFAGRVVLRAPLGHERGALVGAGRAAVRIRRCDEAEGAALGHGLELVGEELRLRARDPAARDLRRGELGAVARDAFVKQLDAGRDDELVVGIAALFADDGPAVRVEADDRVPNHAHTVAVGERVVGDREVLHRDGARDELGRAVVADEVRVAVDERDVKILVEELEVLGGRGAAHACAHHDDPRAAGGCEGLGGSLGPGGAGRRSERGERERGHEPAALDVDGFHFTSPLMRMPLK